MNKTNQHVTVVPAQPGFWAHMIDGTDGTVGARMAVLAWLVDCRAQPEEWIGHINVVTVDGVANQDYFIEQPDGSCVSPYSFFADNVEDAKVMAKQERMEFLERLADARAKLAKDKSA